MGTPDQRILIHAGHAIDGAGTSIAPAALLVDGTSIVACGSPVDVGPVPDAELIDCTDFVVTPSLVNAHAHLDLTHIGPQPYDGDFINWIDMVRQRRAMTDAEIAAAVDLGIERSLAGGVGLLGDIAGAASAIPEQRRRGRLPGVSYLEIFGNGAATDLGLQQVRELGAAGASPSGGVVTGLQPHAPYSCARSVFAAACDFRGPLCTHLAETVAERTFTMKGSGPFRDFLTALGLDDGRLDISGLHPVDHLIPALGSAHWSVVHLNDIEEHHGAMLDQAGAHLVYCPRASAYFGHPQEGAAAHRYRALLDAGLTVALGTDSIINLNTPQRISVIDDMRLLFQRDQVHIETLMTMATIHGATSLGWTTDPWTMHPGSTAGLLCHPCAPGEGTMPERWMRDDRDPQWIIGPHHDDTWCTWVMS